ncbi:MAG: V-type ATP synthase subunit F [Candidatus Micrarchaeota archaeon]
MTIGKIAVLGEHHFTIGFMLAGVQNVFTIREGKEGEGESSSEQKLIELIDSKQYSVIYISEKLSEQMDWKIKKKISTLAYPVIVPLPDITGESKEAANIKALIKRALGFDVITK